MFAKSLNNIYIALMVSMLIMLSSCDESELPPVTTGKGVFILNEGNFTWNNASLSVFNADSASVQNNVFYLQNGVPLGDVAHSMTIHQNRAYLVINGSNKIYVIDSENYTFLGKISGLTSPRYIQFVDDNKAYISDLYSKEISIVNADNLEIIGTIPLNHNSEQMLLMENFLLALSWSYDSLLFKIDPETDQVVDSLVVGFQPNSMVVDKNKRVWILCDGGYLGIPGGQQNAVLACVDPFSMQIKNQLVFQDLQDSPFDLQINPAGDSLFFLNQGLYALSILDTELPGSAVIESGEHKFYSLGIHPQSGDLYLGDAISFVQPGWCFRYTTNFSLIDSFSVGINPGFIYFPF
jgi:hypothetical protein